MSTHNDTFAIGDWLRERRLGAQLGLRQFARLISDMPSNVCNIENGSRQPWQSEDKLRRVAEVLGFAVNGEDWETLFRHAKRPSMPPADLLTYLQKPPVPKLLRTMQDRQLSDEEISLVLRYVQNKFKPNRTGSRRTA